jgi:SOS-response transcriptional repressor LexA
MSDEFQEILLYLDIKDASLQGLLKRIIASCSSNGKTEEAINELIKKTDVYGNDARTCENVPFCNLLISFAYWRWGDRTRAGKYAEEAATQFNRCGNQWNRALSIWGKAVVYQDSSSEQAITEYKSAYKLFSTIANNANFKGFHDRFNCSKKITTLINEKIIELESRPSESQRPTSSSNVNQKKNKPHLPSARIVHGVYDIGHASANGVYVMDDEQISEISIDSIEFDEITHKVFNVREGNQIVLGSGGNYHWLKVAGNSMNLAKPVSIEPEDFVLVDVNLAPETGNIVFARLKAPPVPAERAGVIKRYSSNGFESESTESINPIPLVVADIRGVVIAVAKRVREQN